MRQRHGARLQLGALGRDVSRRLPARAGAVGVRHGDSRPDGLRLRAAQSPALRPQSRPLAPRQRLALRGGARHLSAAARGAAASSRPRRCRRRSPSASRRCWPISSRSAEFATEMEAFFEQRLTTCAEAPASLAATGDSAPAAAGGVLARAADSGSGDAFTRPAAISSAPSARSRPPAASRSSAPRRRTASCRCSRATRASGSSSPSAPRSTGGSSAARRSGCWLPECAYRPRGPWEPWPTAPRSGMRRGIEEHLADAGFHYFFVDAHLADAGRPLGLSGDPARRSRRCETPAERVPPSSRDRSPYQAYRVAQARGTAGVAAFVRDPRASMQVWSRFEGYPGDEAYLEFHKMRWPGGLKLWKVTGPGVDLGAKAAVRPGRGARPRAAATPSISRRFSDGIAAVGAAPPREGDRRAVRHRAVRALVVRGPRLSRRHLPRRSRGTGPTVRPVTGSRHLAEHPPRAGHPASRGLVGRQWRLQHVAQRAHRVDLGAALAARGSRSGTPRRARSPRPRPGRCWSRPPASCSWRSPPTGSSSSPPAPRPTTPSGASGSTARDAEALVAALLDGSDDALGPAQRRAEVLAQPRSSLPRCDSRRGRRARRLALAARRLTMTPIRFAFGLHLHQPVGNFDHVFAQHVEDVYRPLLDTLADREFLPVVLHLSGPLLEWLERARVGLSRPAGTTGGRRQGRDAPRRLLRAGPGLAARARPGRADRVDARRGPRRDSASRRVGLWLTERVWEPELAADLSDAGVRYALVDDRHFLATGFSRRAAPRALLDRERRQARRPLSHRRAAPIPDSVPAAGGDRGLPPRAARRRPRPRGAGRRRREIRRLAGHQGLGLRAGMARPVHRDDRTAGGERRGAAEPARRGAGRGPERRHRLPARPARIARWRAGRCHPMPRSDSPGWSAISARRASPGPTARWSAERTGAIFWSSIPSRTGCTRRCRRSRRCARERGDPPEARRAIGRAQCNDAYWHGVFGGLYLPHLRDAIWRNLAAAEAAAPAAARAWPGNGSTSTATATRRSGSTPPAFSAIVSPHRGGAIEEYTVFSRGINFANVLTRRREAYHDLALERQADSAGHGDGGTASIHDIEAGIRLDERPPLDAEDRALGSSGSFRRASGLEDYARGAYWPVLSWARRGLRVHHRATEGRSGADCAWVEGTGRPDQAHPLRAGRTHRHELRVGRRAWPIPMTASRRSSRSPASSSSDSTPAADEWRFPIETVAKSERGLDRTRQGESVTPRWPVRLGKATVEILPGRLDSIVRRAAPAARPGYACPPSPPDSCRSPSSAGGSSVLPKAGIPFSVRPAVTTAVNAFLLVHRPARRQRFEEVRGDGIGQRVLPVTTRALARCTGATPRTPRR